QVCDDPPWQGTWAQNLSDATTTTDNRDFWKAAVKPFACTADGLKAERKGAVSAAFICQAVFRAYGCYGINMDGPGVAPPLPLRHSPAPRPHPIPSPYL